MHNYFGVDIGNSGVRVAKLEISTVELGKPLRIDWCFAEAEVSQASFSSKARYAPTNPQWLDELDRLLASDGIGSKVKPSSPTQWLISSVRRDAQQLLIDYLCSLNDAWWQIVTHQMVPLRIDVEFPEKVGIDRLLAALAATRLSQVRPLVVIQAGSAVTVDLITGPQPLRTGEASVEDLAVFTGGAILPGVPMMLRLLGQATDLLPAMEADDLLGLPDLPGKNTEQAMLCGTASALVGGVQLLIGQYRTKYGSQIPVILSGGDGMRLSPYLHPPILVKTHLVHRGLLRLAELRTQAEQAL